jgi:hypothetical protein
MTSKEANICMIPFFGIYYFNKRANKMKEYSNNYTLIFLGTFILSFWSFLFLAALILTFK